MKTLLKDLPEFAERIENNYVLQDKIKDCLIENEQTLFEDNSENANSLEAVSADDYNVVCELILKELADFVNQNYEWKGLVK